MNLIKLKKLANAGQFADLSDMWPDAVVSDEVEREDLVRIIGQVRRLGEDTRADELLSILLSRASEKGGPAGRFAVASLAATQLPRSELLRRELKHLSSQMHPDYPLAGQLAGRILEEHVDLDKSLDLLNRYLHLRPGAFFSDRSHLDPGMVESVDAEKTTLRVSFSGRHEEIGRAQVATVIILPADHFHSTLLYRPEELRALATEDPETFVVRAVSSTRDNTCSYRELRGHFLVLEDEAAWKKWWTKTRTTLKTSTRLEMSGTAQPVFRLLQNERSYAVRMREQFAKLKEPVAILGFVLERLVESRKEKQHDEGLLTEMGNTAARQAGQLLKSDPGMTLACLAVHAEVEAAGAPVVRMNPRAALQVIGSINDPSQLPAHLGDRLLLSVLHFVKKVDAEGWTVFWGAVLPRTGRMTADMMARELLAADRVDVLAESMKAVLGHATASPEVFFWFWKAMLTETRTSAALSGDPAFDMTARLEALFDLLDATGRMSAMSDDKRLRRVLDQSQEMIQFQDGVPIRTHLENLSEPEARRLKLRIDENGGLRAGTRTTLLNTLRGAHPDLFIETAKAWEKDVNYTTSHALNRRQSQLDQLVQEDLPAVAKQIGEAASHGDLSENAEYTAALEKRDQITSRATRMESELAKAELITREMAATDFVNVGSRVHVRDLVNEREETYAFLGVWDSDPEHGVLSYKAPLALAFMGALPGDQVEYGEEGQRRRWEILSVESAL